jgi:hypothetical protein
MKRKFVVCFLFFIAGSIFAQTPRFSIGGSFGLGPIMDPDGTVLGGNLSPIQVDWQMTEFISLGSGLNFYFAPQYKYTAPKQTDPDSGILETYAGMETHIIFPLILQLTYNPNIFSIGLGGGLYVAPVVMNTTVERTNDNGYTVGEAYGKNLFTAEQNNPFGFVVTGSFGVKFGRGIIFLDMSYLRDFSEVTVKFNGTQIGHHLWNMLAFNIGYKHGFLTR